MLFCLLFRMDRLRVALVHLDSGVTELKVVKVGLYVHFLYIDRLGMTPGKDML